jgi:hypothetical protein
VSASVSWPRSLPRRLSHGMCRWKIAPPPGQSCASAWPPWAAAMAATIDRPRPAFSGRRVSRRVKRSKIRPCSPAGMPGVAIGDAEQERVAVPGGGQLDGHVGWGVLGRIGGQLHDRLCDALPVEFGAAVGGGADAPGPVVDANGMSVSDCQSLPIAIRSDAAGTRHQWCAGGSCWSWSRRLWDESAGSSAQGSRLCARTLGGCRRSRRRWRRSSRGRSMCGRQAYPRRCHQR